MIAPISIFVNENLITSIASGQIKELRLYPGDKNISFSLLNSNSSNYYVSIKPNEIKYSIIKVKLGGWNNKIVFEEVEAFDISSNSNF